jgi:hypothetical protein
LQSGFRMLHSKAPAFEEYLANSCTPVRFWDN